MLNIVLEGCDGVGKSTLAEALAHKNGMDVLHLTRHSLSTFAAMLSRYSFALPVIMDRGPLSEYVYAKLFGREELISREMMQKLLIVEEGKGFKTVVLDCDPEVIAARIEKRGNEGPEIVNNLRNIRNAYIDAATDLGIPIIDVTGLSVAEIVEEIEKRF